MLIADALRIKRTSQLGDEIIFPLEPQDDFGRIAAQTAKQVVIQKIREAEKLSILDEFGHNTNCTSFGTVRNRQNQTQLSVLRTNLPELALRR